MSKAVLISIHPRWCEKIASGEKTIEIRKTRPKLETPFRCYIYRTKGTVSHIINGKWVKMEVGGTVIGEFTCDAITRVNICGFWDDDGRQLENQIKETCLTPAEVNDYLGTKAGYDWHISDLRIYDTPRDLGEFSPVCIYKADDGTCPTRRVACSFQRFDYNQDGTINIVECGRVIERPPQSWCYVEEDDNGNG